MKILEEWTEDYEIINSVMLENEQKKVSIDRLVAAQDNSCKITWPGIHGFGHRGYL